MNRTKCRLVEHTSDLGLEGWGRTAGDLFANLAGGMFSLMTDLTKVGRRDKLKIKLEAADYQSLLVDWLSELIYLMESRREFFVFFRVAIKEQPGRLFLAAQITGEKMDEKKHTARLMIKAVTYHQLAVNRTPAGWQGRVIFDV